MAVVLITNINFYTGTAAERAAMNTTGMPAGSVFEETDTGLKYKWSGTAWYTGTDETVALAAGTSLIGKVGIDQVTANANEVVTKTGSVVAATLAAETTKVIGKVGSDLTTRTPYNTTMTLADTEYSQALPANTKRIVAWVRDGDDTFNFRLAFATGKVATPTEPYNKFNGDILYDTGIISLASGTLYFACSAAGKSMTLEIWS